MTSTYTPNKNIELPENGDYVNTWSTPVNNDFTAIDTALGGNVTLNATGASGTTTLTYTQYRPFYIIVSGTLTANVTYQFPSGVGGQWVIYNGTSGAYAVTFSSGGGGSSYAPLQGTRSIVLSDGTNILPAAGPGGSNTQVQYNSIGALAGSSNLTFNGTTLTAASLAVSGVSANSVLIGEGSSAVTGIAPGTAGNLMIDTGTAWTSGYGFVPPGYFQNLVIMVASTTTITVSAASVVMTNSSGLGCARAVSSTVSTGSTGLNGLDIGTVAASTWYYVWAVSNGTTIGAVLSLSNTAPNSAITSTYPYYDRIGAVVTNASSQLMVTLQKGRKVQYVVGTTGTTTAYPLIVSGNMSLSAVSVSPYVPATASRIVVQHGFSNGAASNSNTTIGPNANAIANYEQVGSGAGAYYLHYGFVDMELETTNIYFYSNGYGVTRAVGWEDNI